MNPRSASARTTTAPELSLVVPMYNEAPNCRPFFATVTPILESLVDSHEIICVSDGSTDETLLALHAARTDDPRIKVVNLSRNFGKEAALTAGIDLASGRAVIPMDADLQDPPEVISDLVAEWRKGAQVVLAQRVDRRADNLTKRVTSKWFYDLFARLVTKPAIPKDVGDFRLMDRVVVDALKRLPERSRFMKGLFAWVGYRQVTVQYARRPRHAGASKFNYLKLWNFALDGIFSFSALPLKVWTYFGLGLSGFALAYMTYLIIRTMITGILSPGYASMMSVILFFNGVVLLGLGIIGEYISRIYTEVKNRPIYLINELEGFDAASAPAAPEKAPRRRRRTAVATSELQTTAAE